MELYICQSCGHVAFSSKPELCPVCATYIFERNDALFRESREKNGKAEAKHVPAVTVISACGFVPENDCTDVLVRVGATLHPMEEKHFIRFIDCYSDSVYVGRSYLSPGLNPAACFHLKTEGKSVTLVEHCSIHGHWMTEEVIPEQ
jgi:superoxide reductase